jgi:hypothetical protein
MNGFKIEKLTAFIAVDPADGDEGVIGIKIGDNWVPLIAADHIRAKEYFPMALKICRDSVKELRILQFDNRQDVTKDYETDNISEIPVDNEEPK